MSEQSVLGPVTIKRIIGDYKKFDMVNPKYFDIIHIDYSNVPKTNEILKVYFLMYGLQGTLYEGGQYIGLIDHDPAYPSKAPDYYVLTPNGRFAINKKICLTNSKFHSEDWAAGAWNLVTILEGFSSVWHSEVPNDMVGTSHISDTPTNQLKLFASQSASYNMLNCNELYSKFPKVHAKYNPYTTD